MTLLTEKRPSLRALAPLIALAASSTLVSASEITVDAGRGPVTVHIPDSYVAGTNTPLVILLHRFNASGQAQEAYMDFLDVHEEYGFLYAYPDGTPNGNGTLFWNATDACCDFADSGVDDSGYLASLLDAIEAQLTVDPRRIYFVGHSNGGFMAHRMACDHSDRIAAVVSLAGAAWKDPQNCGSTSPVHVLQIHGTNDATILYGGGALGGGVVYPGAVESTEQWATRAGCSLVPDETQPPINLDKSIPGPETTKRRYLSNCDPLGSGELWTIAGGAHLPNLSNPFTRHVIEWLYQHPKPGIDYERYCSPNELNSTGMPGRQDATGSDALAHDDLTLVASQLPVNQFGYFIGSLDPDFVPMPGGSDGNLCIATPFARFSQQIGSTGPNGILSASIPLKDLPTQPPQDVMTGQTWHFQAWHRDTGGTSNFTDGICILFR